MTPRAQRTFRDPIRYEIGKDLDPATYEDLIVKVSDWFREWRSTTEPAQDARFRIRCCLEGKTLGGQPWHSHWSSSFATRMRMLCRFDVATMQPIRTGDEKRKQKKDRAKVRETERRQANTAANDALIPPLVAKTLDQRVNYGAKAIPVAENEADLWAKMKAAYLEQFPELRTVNAEAELSMLCDLHVVHERNRLKLVMGLAIDPAALSENTKLMADIKKALGIHPDQLARRTQETESASVAEAAGKFDALPKDLRDKFALEEFLVLFQMFHTPSPRGEGDGHQIDEIGLFGQTRCRTCACAKCGQRNYVGISIDEITEHLQAHGVIELEHPAEDTAPTGVEAETQNLGGVDGEATLDGPVGT